MLNKLFDLLGLTKTTNILGYINYAITLLEEEYEKDKDAKNAAIDALIEILQKHKNT